MNNRIKQLEIALEVAMQYMPHGLKYKGPSKLQEEDKYAFELCNAARSKPLTNQMQQILDTFLNKEKKP